MCCVLRWGTWTDRRGATAPSPRRPARAGCSRRRGNSACAAPVDTSSPRATLRSFLANVGEAYERWRNRSGRAETLVPAQRALHTLDLRHVGEALIFEIGIDSALYL